MFSKNFLIATLFAGAAFAAPTVTQENSLETRADWQANKCDANIRITGKPLVPPFSRSANLKIHQVAE